MSKTMSMRLRDDQLAKLESLRRRLNQRSISATLGLLLEEKLRQEQFDVEFLETGAGRQAYLRGTGWDGK